MYIARCPPFQPRSRFQLYIFNNASSQLEIGPVPAFATGNTFTRDRQRSYFLSRRRAKLFCLDLAITEVSHSKQHSPSLGTRQQIKRTLGEFNLNFPEQRDIEYHPTISSHPPPWSLASHSQQTRVLHHTPSRRYPQTNLCHSE